MYNRTFSNDIIAIEFQTFFSSEQGTLSKPYVGFIALIMGKQKALDQIHTTKRQQSIVSDRGFPSSTWGHNL